MAIRKPKVQKFFRDVRAALTPLADTKRAVGARAYMRNQFECLGISTPARRAAVRPLIRALKPVDSAEVRKAVEGLWAMREREYAYVACDLLERHHGVLSLADVPWLLDLARRGAWWDTVDSIVKIVGKVVRRSGAKGVRAMDAAVRHNSLWIRRVAMLHQLGWRADVDTKRLFRYAELLAVEKEFFIRKAIGWALRDYAWHDWRAVDKFLKATNVEFAGLTVREARKNFERLKRASRKTPPRT